MAWIYLFLAGLSEVGWAIGLKFTDGFTKFVPSVATVLTLLLSFTLLGQALRHLPIGTAYAVWTGIGAVGTAIFGMIWLGEPKDLLRLACLGLIVAGILGLRLVSPA